MRSATYRRAQYHDDDDIADPRPWETRSPVSTYGSAKDKSALAQESDLPLFNMESELDKEKREASGGVGVTRGDDTQGKWDKGHGAGPGVGGRRGLPRRQRVDGWVRELVDSRISTAECWPR
jgi:dolichyl-phosphate-mannose-protein mannosyltransferase